MIIKIELLDKVVDVPSNEISVGEVALVEIKLMEVVVLSCISSELFEFDC